MSKESAKIFVKRIQEDKEFAGAMEKLAGREEKYLLLFGGDFRHFYLINQSCRALAKTPMPFETQHNMLD